MRYFRVTAEFVLELPGDPDRDALADAVTDPLIDVAEARGGDIGGGLAVAED